MAADSMDVDMDIDLTLEQEPDMDDEVARLNREAAEIEAVRQSFIAARLDDHTDWRWTADTSRWSYGGR